MIKCVLLDIEGTTTPIDFVHQTLFPFAKERIEEFVTENKKKLEDELAALRQEVSEDPEFNARAECVEELVGYLKFLIDTDRKSTPLKSIQGKIWQTGYEDGELKSVIYDDVFESFDIWKKQGLRIAIYSSGSVRAQELLFGYSDHGDLTGYLSAYFDTNIGHKKEKSSYEKIAGALDLKPDEVFFVSDVREELEAAKSVGMKTALSIRPGNKDVAAGHGFTEVFSFKELDIDE